ncbi:MAG: type I restriction-modification system subunit M [Chloroflexi bacterium]|nr:type I restriction-modification system subunit M [Chloroflexota bacterium]MCI0643949.1 type I restriction-modification system subunit M [Chloroflexota bacterium]MCI0732086.1 type I restriction-modification system subunit M [Chloroflexota bacterium]
MINQTPTRIQDIEQRLWRAADELRANSRLSAQEYSVPVLGLIFLRYAEHKFVTAGVTGTSQVPVTSSQAPGAPSRRRPAGKLDYQARGVLYVPPEARYSYLLNLPEGSDLGRAINEAMKAIERENDDLAGVLPQTYTRFENRTLATLLRTLNLPDAIEGDAFGRIYEYFLGNFAMSEGQRGGEFFTPTAIVRLIVEVIEPFHGRILDPAAGSGGMFVQSARFIAEHQAPQVPGTSEVPGTSPTLSIYGQERLEQTIRLCKMNLAVHGLAGDVRQANSYYDDPHHALGRFDFVMANPPFNVNNVDRERLEKDPRFPFGPPRVDNANYLWIQLFYSALNDRGRAGFVMANSASDARHSEQDIRRQLIQTGAVDVMIAIGSNFFYTVTLPCTLWFLDRAKSHLSQRPEVAAPLPPSSSAPPPPRSRDTVLFLDARRLYRQLSRAHRDFTPAQIEFLANVVRLYRGEPPEHRHSGENEGGVALPAWDDLFPGDAYRDVPGLCKVATLAEIEVQGWSLNPGRYVGVAEREADDFDFFERLEELNEELELLNNEANELEARIAVNVSQILESELG